uniref:HTH myb-type domain-containing protein n=1 Tax=Ditylum brightwellii TaxID=49249 RepID=A0A7S1ZJN8_9STRA|mmetsp:Transcript_32955/g.49116  ORF Transcript_32955/g.49116 Transcript_32955/m.49116 type:complete len:650 (+) Transcript_32955:459-2408(+)
MPTALPNTSPSMVAAASPVVPTPQPAPSPVLQSHTHVAAVTVAAPGPAPVAAPMAGVPANVSLPAPQPAPAPVHPTHMALTHVGHAPTLPVQVARPAPAHVAPPTAVAMHAPSVNQVAVATPLTNSLGTSQPVQAPLPVASLVPKLPPKPKKAKSKAPTVTMATAATATPSGSGQGSQGENTGRWTADEHRLFLQGLEQHGKGWKKIASLIKSRTVVQIRTHAQKYFQKLAKARQNGEEGDVSMEGRGGAVSVSTGPAASSATQSAKRRRQSSGTKRKAISSVVASAQREGKKMAVVASAGHPGASVPPLPAVAPALTPYVMSSTMQQRQHHPAIVSPIPAPQPVPVGAPIHAPAPAPHPAAPAPAPVPSITTAHGTITGAALEDSLFRYLTPSVADNAHKMPQAHANIQPSTIPSLPMPEPIIHPQVNDVARQAGANPITLPTDINVIPGEGSPTGVADFGQFPSWADCKDATPSWYAKGSDVDELLNEADALDWLADSGDLNETYQPPPSAYQVQIENNTSLAGCSVTPPPLCETSVSGSEGGEETSNLNDIVKAPSTGNFSQSVPLPPVVSAVPSSDENHGSVMPPILAGSGSNRRLKALSSTDMFNAAEVDDNFAVFDSHFDEQAFVSALLENNGESTSSLPVLS